MPRAIRGPSGRIAPARSTRPATASRFWLRLNHLLAGRGEWGRKSQEDITDAHFDQSRHMQKQLSRAGKTVKLVKLRGEDHYLLSPETRLECLRETVAFVNAHIGSETS